NHYTYICLQDPVLLSCEDDISALPGSSADARLVLPIHAPSPAILPCSRVSNRCNSCVAQSPRLHLCARTVASNLGQYRCYNGSATATTAAATTTTAAGTTAANCAQPSYRPRGV